MTNNLPQSIQQALENASFDRVAYALAKSDPFPENEKDWSRVFGRWLSGQACFVPQEKGWRFWDGVHWVRDGDTQKVRALCKTFVDEVITYAQTSANIKDTERSKYVTAANKYNKFNEREKLVKDAQCEVTVLWEQFDADQDKLNLQNGVYDLKSMTFRPGHHSDELMTKVASVSFDPKAKSEEWEKFIDESLQGDTETIEFLQTICGLALTCDVSYEGFFLILGPTRSGKSATVGVLLEMLNDQDDGYAISCEPETLAAKKNKDASRSSSDVARLASRRLVVTSEPPRSMLFNVAQLKNMTGRDPITARPVYEKDITFRPVFTLIMTANDAPRVNDMTLFDSDRVHVIPYNNHVAAERRDPKLKDRLASSKNLSGILNWCLDGLRIYQRNGERLRPSRMSADATQQYRDNADKIGNFLTDCTKMCEGNNASGDLVWEAFQSWCISAGYESGGKQSFYADLKSRGLMTTATVDGKTVRNAVKNIYLLPQK